LSRLPSDGRSGLKEIAPFVFIDHSGKSDFPILQTSQQVSKFSKVVSPHHKITQSPGWVAGGSMRQLGRK
jgi:hypothetical protein